MTEKRFNNVGGYLYDGDECIGHYHDVRFRDEIMELLNEQHETIQALHCEINKKQSILETKIKNLQIDLDKLTYMDTSDLNPQAVADVRTVIEISLSALKQLEKELKGD